MSNNSPTPNDPNDPVVKNILAMAEHQDKVADALVGFMMNLGESLNNVQVDKEGVPIFDHLFAPTAGAETPTEEGLAAGTPLHSQDENSTNQVAGKSEKSGMWSVTLYRSDDKSVDETAKAIDAEIGDGINFAIDVASQVHRNGSFSLMATSYQEAASLAENLREHGLAAGLTRS